ncbi:MAG: asparagine synthase (glutamine-hydrolyzing) [Limnohabitans sp.]|uniref:asparagine synthase (glutamine-hydrolyzing) n=1 Tax=Limnohabitans sp. TaxID=1907725 RepID=UPI0025FA6FA3|nr:asparagine synthase (glutamine-hydrolyzing) [Limnohabitans sp.]MCO4089683.1 asparagine synthase (glutamine-hydrolyzing) [Limnohabitans sp.]
MCGIAGFIKKSSSFESRLVINMMTDLISHRGPDGSGSYIDGQVVFGHRRLSIIDLSNDGHQPMHHVCGHLVITYNGEIYNYLEIREELISKGHYFRSASDTEVILAAYLEWGVSCVDKFNGMWAFAIHDKKNNIIFCSRDRFGVKPFYYIDVDSGFYFGSEIRQLLPFLKEIKSNNKLLTDFLLTSISDHTDETFYKGISKLPAGHNLIYRLDENKFEINRFYELHSNVELRSLSPEDATDLYRSRLEESVKLRLRADVPVGTCLSGGLDSSSIASIAGPIYKRASGLNFSAITAISEQESNDESAYAKKVVDHSNLNWLQVKPSYQDFVDSLPSVVKSQEEPFGSTSLTMQYFVMKEARKQRIPVLLDGQGGDETLLGYPKYYGSYLASSFREGGASSFLRALKDAGTNNSKMSLANAMFFLVGGLVAPARYLVYLSRSRYLAKIPAYPQHLTDFARKSLDDFELQKLEITNTNLPVLLRYEDKNSMAHSIETRLPFLDYRVVETALSLPRDCKIRGGWSKWVLRNAMDGRMPPEITWRKNKFGFEAPENMWMKNHLSVMKDAVINSSLICDLTKKSHLAKSFDELNMRVQWRLYSIALWQKEFGIVG